MISHSPNSPSAVTLTNISKSYGSNQAVRDVSLAFPKGQITAVIGENGAGKSTLMKMLAGVVSPTSGTVTVEDNVVHFRSARDASRAGIGMVYQETALMPNLTVWENVVLGWELRDGFSQLSQKASIKRVLDLAEQYGLPVRPNDIVHDLTVSARQQVEILKVLHRQANVIILDEPTSALTPQERRGLFEAMFKLRDSGHAVIFISHKLNEILEVARDIHVMRAGSLVASYKAAETDIPSLSTAIVGKKVEVIEKKRPLPSDDAILEVRDLTVESGSRGVSSVSLTVNRGTVVGVAGVSGSGQDELIGGVAGLLRPKSGSIKVRGVEAGFFANESLEQRVEMLRRNGVGYVPSDRNDVGSTPTAPLWLAAIAGRLSSPEFNNLGFLRLGNAKKLARRIIELSSVRASGPGALCRSLSGGNLQKFLVGRELDLEPQLIIAEEPTRGVDIGAALDLRRRIRAVAENGGAALVASSDLDELLQICDEIHVLFDGEIIASFTSDTVTEERLGAAMIGVPHAEEQERAFK